jgi:hypothetical protein
MDGLLQDSHLINKKNKGDVLMNKIKLYRYVGRNGTITSPILLDNIQYYVYYKLIP